MKKKTLVSVLAMTSASMAAYANANLDQIKSLFKFSCLK